MQQEVQRMRESEVSEEELKAAKETVLNSLVFVVPFDTRAKTLARMMAYDYYGYPMDFFQQYQKALANVTRADVLRVSQAHLDPSRFSLVVVGNPDTFGQHLEILGRPVTPISLAIKPPAAAPALSSSAREALQILARAQKASGGADKLAAVKGFPGDRRVRPDARRRRNAREAAQPLAGPRSLARTAKCRVGKPPRINHGTQGWISTPQGEGPLVGLQLDQVRGTLFRLYFRLLLSDRIPGRTLTVTGNGGVEVSSAAGDSALITFDSFYGVTQDCLL